MKNHMLKLSGEILEIREPEFMDWTFHNGVYTRTIGSIDVTVQETYDSILGNGLGWCYLVEAYCMVPGQQRPEISLIGLAPDLDAAEIMADDLYKRAYALIMKWNDGHRKERATKKRVTK